MGIGSNLSYKARRRWSLVILLVGLPLYVIAVVTVLNLIGQPPFLVELLVYVVLGFAWIMPFKSVFRGIGQADPDKDDDSR
jgi:predicted MFS family arabinose efflux permease